MECQNRGEGGADISFLLAARLAEFLLEMRAEFRFTLCMRIKSQFYSFINIALTFILATNFQEDVSTEPPGSCILRIYSNDLAEAFDRFIVSSHGGQHKTLSYP